MISEDGEIAHIDFGCIMNKEPRLRTFLDISNSDYWFGRHAIKFNETILRPLLNDEKNIEKPFNDAGYKKLIDACMDGFFGLRSKI